jgi:threonine dehydrogenase-like Zn-dependent dehydrogenase
MGARVIALDTSPERRALASGFGAAVVIDPAQDDAVEALRELTGGRGVDLSLDCSGVAEARRAAVRAVRTWGKAAFVGEGGDVTLDVSPDMLRRQVTIIASWTFSRHGQADCADFVASRGVDVDQLFSDRWRLDQAEEAYRLFDTQSTGKGVFLA